MKLRISPANCALLSGLFALLRAAVPSAHAQPPPTFWEGPTTNFTHADVNAPGDQLTPDVILTRAAREAIFNSAEEQGFNGLTTVPDGSPVGTEWAVLPGNFDSSVTNLVYGSFYSVVGGPGNPPSRSGAINETMVLHLINDNIYLELTMTEWGSGSAGDPSFAYTRTTPGSAPPPTTNFPTCSITNPLPNVILAAPASIPIQVAAAQDGGSVTNVQFFTNGLFAGSVITSPFNLTLSGVGAGSYTLTAVATGTGLSTTSAPVTVTVANPPTVSITSPASGKTIAALVPFQVSVTAGQVGGTVTNVSLFAGTNVLGTLTNNPFTFNVGGLAIGTYVLRAVATGSGLSTTSAIAGIFVKAPPQVSLTNPIAGAVLIAPASLLLQASATSSAGTVTNVQFFNGASSLGSVTNLPFNLPLTNLAVGPYSFTAVASAAGLSATSAVVSVSVISQITSISNSVPSIKNGTISFSFTTQPGSNYVVQTSSNLVTWIPLVTNTASGTSTIFSTNAASQGNQYFRTVQVSGH